MYDLILYGSSGHASMVLDSYREGNPSRRICIVDDFLDRGEMVFDVPVIGGFQEAVTELIQNKSTIIVAIGDNFARGEIVCRLKASCPAVNFQTVIHPSAIIGSNVCIGEGSVIGPGVVINANALIGDHCIVNTGSIVEHDSRLNTYSSIAPSVVMGGGCIVGECSAIGIGAVLLHRISIGKHTVIGAGAVVTENLESGIVAYGVPARKQRNRVEGEVYL